MPRTGCKGAVRCVHVFLGHLIKIPVTSQIPAECSFSKLKKSLTAFEDRQSGSVLLSTENEREKVGQIVEDLSNTWLTE